MEFLVPGFLLLLIAVMVVFFIIPRFGPLATLLGAGLLLTAGIFHHYKLFRFEYRNATWADRLKAYGPGILYFIMTLFILGFIFSLWGGASVPVPEEAPAPAPAPKKEESAESTALLSNSPLTNTLNVIKNTATNALEGAANVGKQFVNNVRNYVPFAGQGPAPAQGQQGYAPRPNYRNTGFFSQY